MRNGTSATSGIGFAALSFAIIAISATTTAIPLESDSIVDAPNVQAKILAEALARISSLEDKSAKFEAEIAATVVKFEAEIAARDARIAKLEKMLPHIAGAHMTSRGQTALEKRRSNVQFSAEIEKCPSACVSEINNARIDIHRNHDDIVLLSANVASNVASMKHSIAANKAMISSNYNKTKSAIGSNYYKIAILSVLHRQISSWLEGNVTAVNRAIRNNTKSLSAALLTNKIAIANQGKQNDAAFAALRSSIASVKGYKGSYFALASSGYNGMATVHCRSGYIATGCSCQIDTYGLTQMSGGTPVMPPVIPRPTTDGGCFCHGPELLKTKWGNPLAATIVYATCVGF